MSEAEQIEQFRQLAEFLLARLGEDEAVAREAADSESFEGGNASWCPGWLGTGIRHLVRNVDVECYEPGHEDDPALCGRPARYAGTHIARHDPARVLVECEAGRRIVEQLWDYVAAPDPTSSDPSGTQALWIVKQLALPYAGHESYREEWKP